MSRRFRRAHRPEWAESREATRKKWRGWAPARRAAYRDQCEVPTCGFAFKLSAPPTRGHVDHICPRALAGNGDVSPHDSRNLMNICERCHGFKGYAEELLAGGDVLGFIAFLNRHGFPMERIKAAFELYGHRIFR
jgi:5-methylcytosine-specific restriction endonuclease McrA